MVGTSCKVPNSSLLASSAAVKRNVKGGRRLQKVTPGNRTLGLNAFDSPRGARVVHWLLFLVSWGGCVAESELILGYTSY